MVVINESVDEISQHRSDEKICGFLTKKIRSGRLCDLTRRVLAVNSRSPIVL